MSPNTNVASGELFETGSPTYDEYFATVHDLHAAVATGRLQERDAYTKLATTLQMLPTAEPEQILKKLRNEAAKLPRMRLVIDVDGERRVEVTLLDEQAVPDRAVRRLMDAIETTANASLVISARMAQIPERVHRMQNVGAVLAEGAAKDFADRPRAERDRIALELKAALAVLSNIANESRAVAATNRVFTQDVQTVLHTSVGPAKKADPDDEQTAERRSDPATQKEPKPPPKPRAKRAPAVDFNP